MATTPTIRPPSRIPDEIDAYVRAAHDAGCPEEQLRAFLKAGIVLQPRQLEASAAARECDVTDGPIRVGMGGAMGGGKSHWLLSQLGSDDCQRVPGLKCLLLRKVGKANRENLEDLRLRLFLNLPHRYNRTEGFITFANGSRILAGHFQNESDIDAYLGLEYDAIGIEEMTTLSASKVRQIRTRLRTSKRGWRPREYSTTNPGGVGHGFYKKEYVEPYRKGLESDSRFVPSTVYDNRFVNPEYRRNLEALVGWQRRAWLLGDWDIAAGQFFTNFRRETHVIQPFAIPSGWRVWCAMDYGFTHFTVVYLLAQDGDGNLYVVDEHAERGWLPPRHAASVKAMLERNGVSLSRLYWFVAGADVFAKKDGITIAEKYQAEGIKLSAANDDRINGSGEILSLLGDVEAEPAIPPRLYVFERCARLIECLPALQHDPHRPEDVLKVDCDEDGLGGDDFYDSVRYACMAARKPAPEKVVYMPAFAAGRRSS
jgi:phage terminase large subunit